MGWREMFGLERRASLENQNVKVSADNFLAFFGGNTAGLPAVTIESALKVPAVGSAVAFLSRTLATLPLHSYRRTKDGPVKITGQLQVIVHENPNDEMDSFKFRQYFWQQVFTGGRGLAWIERAGTSVAAIWPMDPVKTVIRRENGRTTYVFDGKKEYAAADVIDVPFMLKADQLGHYGPIALGEKAIQTAIAMNDYTGGFFNGGGVPPLALVGPAPASVEGYKRAQEQINKAVKQANASKESIFPIPLGHELKPVGFDPEKGQMTEARRFQVEEIARVYQMPPVFLQDLTHGTFSNSEQQDLHFVKHLISQWVKAFEGELNLKLFGRFNNGRYVEHNLDGLLRGDFATRMAGLAQSVQNSLLTPDEARALDNRPAMPGGDRLYIQGATVPLGSQDAAAAPTGANNGGVDDPGT